MDKLKAMATFVRIVDSGSLSAAADAQGQSPASVVRSLAALERSLNVRLLNRTTRQLSLTDEGRDYLARCRRILTEVSEAESALQERQKGPSGIVGITAPETFGRYHVAPLVNRFLSDHPAMRVNLVLDDKVVNLVEAGLDLAIRIGHPRDSSLVVRPLGQMSTVVCASPDYLESQGEPVTPQELGHRPCVLFAPQGPLWSFHDQTVRINPTLVTNRKRPTGLHRRPRLRTFLSLSGTRCPDGRYSGKSVGSLRAGSHSGTVDLPALATAATAGTLCDRLAGATHHAPADGVISHPRHDEAHGRSFVRAAGRCKRISRVGCQFASRLAPTDHATKPLWELACKRISPTPKPVR